jgi:hypothetical protein
VLAVEFKLLWGKIDMGYSGRLAYTIASSTNDYPAQLVTGGTDDEILNITYSEGCVVFDSLFLPTIVRLPHANQPVYRLSSLQRGEHWAAL